MREYKCLSGEYDGKKSKDTERTAIKQLSEDPLLVYVRGQEMLLIEASGVEIYCVT